MDPIRMAGAAEVLAEALGDMTPIAGWTERAERYRADMERVDAEIAGLLAAIPEERRLLVTNHGSLGYFAARYDFEVIGVVIPGGSTLAEPSAADLADLVAVIDGRDIGVVFAETTAPAALAEALAAEASRPVTVVELHTGSLGGPGSGAETLAELLLTDAALIAAALGEAR
jgi:zinc/manganese transport system substrate-binding protein